MNNNPKPWLSIEYIEFLENTQSVIVDIALNIAINYVGKIKAIIDLNKGEASAVYKIEGVLGSCVIKLSRSPNMLLSEAYALELWRQKGVNTPHIFKVGIKGDIPFLLMEYISYPKLNEIDLSKEELKTILYNLGRQMSLMHSIKVEGFGNLDFEYGIPK